MPINILVQTRLFIFFTESEIDTVHWGETCIIVLTGENAGSD